MEQIARWVDTRRRTAVLCVLMSAAMTTGLVLYPPALVARLDHAVYDTVVRIAGAHPPDHRVAIVDIDERSVSSIGQWPWRRDVVARLVARISELGATMTALDIVFSERDRSQLVETDTAPDAVFADVLARGRVAVGHAFTFDDRVGTTRDCLLHPLGVAVVQRPDRAVESPPLFRASGAVCSLPPLARAAGVSGFLNAAPDPDGILRRMPLLLELDGRLYPSLALAALTAVTRPRHIELRVINSNSAALILDNQTVPLDGRSNALLRYRGGKRAFQYLSAVDVLTGALPAGTLHDKLVFVGATALGMQEMVSTPFGVLFPGVEVQATVADNLLSNSFITRPEHALVLETLALVVFGGALALLVCRGGVACAAFGLSLGVIAVWVTCVSLLSRGVFVSPLILTIGLFLSFGAAAVCRFTGDLKAAVNGLERARRETDAAAHVKDEFLRTVSHELRTPLTAIQGYTQILAKGALKDEQRSRALATIERRARAQTQLIDDLLDVSSAVGGTLRLDVRTVAVSDIIDPNIEALKPALAAKGLRLDTLIDPSVTTLCGDPKRLQQVVFNLLSNAIKFTPNGGRVELLIARAGSFVEIAVSDTGIGIASTFLPHVFERFSQQDGAATRHFGGLGLGLALVRHLVELHGGTITVESEGEGRGATFRVRLPVNAADASVLAIPSGPTVR